MCSAFLLEYNCRESKRQEIKLQTFAFMASNDKAIQVLKACDSFPFTTMVLSVDHKKKSTYANWVY
jgi:hypothetical protein